MPTKRDLGVSYLLGSGLGLIATLTWFFLLGDGVSLGLIVATVTATVLSGTFVFVGYWMYHTGIAGDTVWTVAKWSALGLLLPVLLGVFLLLANPGALLQTIVPEIFINVVAVGGVLGLLLGLILEMHREQTELRRLNQRNRVLNRVLRHNIRNDMSVMQIHVDMLDEEADVAADGSLDAIQRKIEEVVSTSEMARRIDELQTDSIDDGPIDVVPLIEDRIGIVRSAHPEVRVSLDLPDEAWASVGPVFESVIDNLVENAIEHHDGDPSIDIVVEPGSGIHSSHRIIIADDGPGIPQEEVELLEKGDESQLEHSNGLGLWLVRWIVEYFGGNVQYEPRPSNGTRVVVEVPQAVERTPAAL